MNNAMSSSKPPLPIRRELESVRRQLPLYGITSQSWKIIVLGAHAIIVIKSIVVILPHVELAHYGST